MTPPPASMRRSRRSPIRPGGRSSHGSPTGETSVMELAKPFAMSQPAISKHLKVLERAGLISRSRDAQRRPCRIEAKRLEEANEWLERYSAFWEASLERLDALLGEIKRNRRRASGEGGSREPFCAMNHWPGWRWSRKDDE